MIELILLLFSSIPPDSEYYHREQIVACRAAAEKKFKWENVEWSELMSLSFYTDNNEFLSIVSRGTIQVGDKKKSVWADCTYESATGIMEVYDFAVGPY
jgi:hypothetical protein